MLTRVSSGLVWLDDMGVGFGCLDACAGLGWLDAGMGVWDLV